MAEPAVELPKHSLIARLAFRPVSSTSAVSFRRDTALVRDADFSYYAAMLIVHVQVHVKTEAVEEFKAATLRNARLSRLEPGVLQFDALQQSDDPAKFVLVEVYRDAAANAAHKETPHYAVWRDAVAPLMAEARASVKFSRLGTQ